MSKKRNKDKRRRGINSSPIQQRIEELRLQTRKALPPPVLTHACKRRKEQKRLHKLSLAQC